MGGSSLKLWGYCLISPFITDSKTKHRMDPRARGTVLNSKMKIGVKSGNIGILNRLIIFPASFEYGGNK